MIQLKIRRRHQSNNTNQLVKPSDRTMRLYPRLSGAKAPLRGVQISMVVLQPRSRHSQACCRICVRGHAPFYLEQGHARKIKLASTPRTARELVRQIRCRLSHAVNTATPLSQLLFIRRADRNSRRNAQQAVFLWVLRYSPLTQPLDLSRVLSSPGHITPIKAP